MSKVVFSSTLTEPLGVGELDLVAGDAVEAVRKMKENGDRSMRTIGSLALCRSLLEAGLVDRFRVVMFPVITGATGRERIYDGYPDVALDMVDSRTFDGRIQLVEYMPEGAGRLKNPARSTYPRTSTLRISHFPDQQGRRYAQSRGLGRPTPRGASRRPVDNRREPK